MAYNNSNGRNAQRRSNNNGVRNNNNRGTFRDLIKSKAPEAFDIALLIRNSASLRRHVSLGIKAQLLNSGRIKPEDKVYVEFELSHFTVNVNGLGTDSRYDDMILLKAFLAAADSIDSQIRNLVNNLTVAVYNEPLTECEALTGKDGITDIANISDFVLNHINTHKDED